MRSATQRYAAALFDLDGTLLDSARDIVASTQYALSLVDTRQPPEAEAILAETGKPLETVYVNLGYPAQPEKIQKFITAYRDHYALHLTDTTRPYPYVSEVLQLLAEAGVKLAVVTTKHQHQAELVLRKTGLLPFFHFVRGWEEGRKHKPDPEPALSTLAALKTEPDQAIMVGDTEQDILTAKNAGIASCAVTCGFRPAPFLVSYQPDFLISCFADLVHIVLKCPAE